MTSLRTLPVGIQRFMGDHFQDIGHDRHRA